MTIKQFNGSWSALEDRLMFRFNTSDSAEYRLWLTRHIAGALIQGSQHLVTQVLEKKHEPEAARAIQEFQHQALKQKTDFRAPYHQAPKLPLGPLPVLVVGLAMKQEGDLMSIDFQLLSKQNLNLKLTISMLQGMILLIDQLQAKANWGVGLAKLETSSSAVSLTELPSGPDSSGTLH